MNMHTCVCSAGHESTAHCDPCSCRNGNFNEVSAAVVVYSPFLLWENGTLSTLPKTGPVISLEIEAISPANPSPPLTCNTQTFIDLIQPNCFSSAVYLFLTVQLLSALLHKRTTGKPTCTSHITFSISVDKKNKKKRLSNLQIFGC